MAWLRGAAAGLGLFVLAAGIVYLTPLRLPVRAAAGREHAAIRFQAEFERAARADLPGTAGAALESRLESWRRVHGRVSPFGFLRWVSEMWPWLLALGLALPLFGALIAARIPSRDARREDRPRTDTEPGPPQDPPPLPPVSAAFEAPPPAGVRRAEELPDDPVSPSRPTSPSVAAVGPMMPGIPRADAPPAPPARTSEPVVREGAPSLDWGFRAATRNAPRRKMPPIVSPNAPKEDPPPRSEHPPSPPAG